MWCTRAGSPHENMPGPPAPPGQVRQEGDARVDGAFGTDFSSGLRNTAKASAPPLRAADIRKRRYRVAEKNMTPRRENAKSRYRARKDGSKRRRI